MMHPIAFGVLLVAVFLLAEESVRDWLRRRKDAIELAAMRREERDRQSQRDLYLQFEQLTLRVRAAVLPHICASGCYECGGPWNIGSPPSVRHESGCAGVDRLHAVDALMKSFRAVHFPEDSDDES